MNEEHKVHQQQTHIQNTSNTDKLDAPHHERTLPKMLINMFEFASSIIIKQ